MIKIAVLVSGGGTNLQALIDAQKAGAFPNGEIALVMASNQKAYALERAKNAGIESVVVSRIMTGRWWKRCKAAALNWWCWQDF